MSNARNERHKDKQGPVSPSGAGAGAGAWVGVGVGVGLDTGKIIKATVGDGVGGGVA